MLGIEEPTEWKFGEIFCSSKESSPTVYYMYVCVLAMLLMTRRRGGGVGGGERQISHSRTSAPPKMWLVGWVWLAGCVGGVDYIMPLLICVASSSTVQFASLPPPPPAAAEKEKL